MTSKEPKENNKYLLLRYAGFGFQLLVGIGLALYAGIWLDKRFNIQTPLLVWILPLIVIAAMIYKVVKDTGRGKP